MTSSAARSRSLPRLVADIGGTNARFALQQPDGRFTATQVLRCAEHPDLASAIRAWLTGHADVSVRVAGVAIATPVDGDAVRMTNLHWAFSIEATRRALGLERLTVLNDFTALALALPHLAETELRPIGGGERRPDATKALLGPGTGLGVSGLVRCGDRWQALASEGGHVTLAAGDEHEAALLAIVRREHAHVSAERLLSGPGLVLLHDAIRIHRGLPPRAMTPAGISADAAAGTCPACVETAQVFSGLLGSVAGNLALTLGSFGGVYLSGGVIAGLGAAFDRAAFRTRFEAKGRFAGYLARIATVEITAEHPALRGVAAALDAKAAAL